MRQQKTDQQKRRFWRRVCIILDAAVLVLMGVFTVSVFMREPSKNYDVDRSIYPIKGIDLSAHNGDVDFLRVAADSVSFVMLKATEGTDFCDAKFSTNYQNARQAGLKVGAYHFFRFDTPPRIQAQHFLRSVSGRTFDLPLAIDVEKWGNTDTYDTDRVKLALKEMLSEIHDAGYSAMIYTNKRGHAEFIDGDFENVPLWICSLSSPPAMHSWHLWQHSHNKHIDGIKGPVDVNTFNGSADSFERWTAPFTIDIDPDRQ